MKNKAPSIAFFVIGICLTIVFKDKPLGMIAGIVFILLAIVQMIRSRNSK